MSIIHRTTFKIIFGLAAVFCVDSGRPQNIVEHTTAQFTANPVRLTDMDVSEFFLNMAVTPTRATSPEARRIQGKLEAHLAQFLQGTPWMPFHQTLGISGCEIQFDHPDEMFCALAFALPALSETTAAQLKQFLRAELEQFPPYAEEGFDHTVGHPRESYDVPWCKGDFYFVEKCVAGLWADAGRPWTTWRN